jgi:hypothetical protein
MEKRTKENIIKVIVFLIGLFFVVRFSQMFGTTGYVIFFLICIIYLMATSKPEKPKNPYAPGG